MSQVNAIMASRLAGFKLNQRLAGKLVALKASAAEPAEPQLPEETREVQVAAKVMAALGRIGVTAAQVEAVLGSDDGIDPAAAPVADPSIEQDAPITDSEIEAHCRAILAELGIEVEEDEPTGSEGEELLDQISELTAQYVQKCGSDPQRLFRGASRLTASLNLALVAAGKESH